ncbi:MlaC/ttg2D family ABC transporter substrate-binding protein [Succinimonas amylolytica]|jgi:phospholipid transport system substrate-binding protein|uniref:MlaC/ttg2D family ABC transporter substrate-binding protein n=1 Tax=Succinimonas amylolytica TaxID=83769 RepID=UPI00036351BB|nr:ABC transporter substrate-binding protein [Succinimonas amylolytica]
MTFNSIKKLASVFMIATAVAFTVPVTMSGTAEAAEQQVDTTNPYTMMKVLADNVFQDLKNTTPPMTTEKARAIITKDLLPYIDNKYSSFKVIGSNLKNTTKEEREAFTSSFTNYIVATYADALKKYTNQTIRVQDPEPITDKITSVKVTISAPGAEDVEVIFKMRLNPKNGTWKAYDMVAEGISLLSAKQSELSGLIRDKGISEVCRILDKHVADTMNK